MRRFAAAFGLAVGKNGGAAVLVWTILGGVSPAAAHECGPGTIELVAGQETILQAVTADLRETDSDYIPMLNGDLLAVDIDPGAPFKAHDARFALTPRAPGTAYLIVEWSYAPTHARGVCATVIQVKPAAAQPSIAVESDNLHFEHTIATSPCPQPIGMLNFSFVNGTNLEWRIDEQLPWLQAATTEGAGAAAVLLSFTCQVPGPGPLNGALTLTARDPATGAAAANSPLTIRVTGDVLPPNQPPVSLDFAPADRLPLGVSPSATGQPLSVPVRGTVVDDYGLRGVTINGFPALFSQQGSLTDDSQGYPRLLRQFAFIGTAFVPEGDTGRIQVRVEDQGGATVDRTHTVFFAASPSAGPPGPPFGLLLNPPDRTTLRIPVSDQIVSIPIRGALADPDGDLVGATLALPNFAVYNQFAFVRYTDGSVAVETSALNSEDLFLQTHFAWSSSGGDPALLSSPRRTAYYQFENIFQVVPAALPREVSYHIQAWDTGGRTLETARTLVLDLAPTPGNSAPVEILLTSLVGSTVEIPDPARPTLLPVEGTIKDLEGNLVDLTVNGLPLLFTLEGADSYDFGGTAILPPIAQRADKPATRAGKATATAELRVRAMDLFGQTAELRRVVVLESLDDSTAIVTAEQDDALPETFALAQNYPNPFNPATTIQYQLAQPAWVELAVFDAAGQKIRVLARAQQGPGRFAVRWDGRDDQGRPLASGVYLYRLRAGAYQETRRLTLLK
jgi:hypothetical protein